MPPRRNIRSMEFKPVTSATITLLAMRWAPRPVPVATLSVTFFQAPYFIVESCRALRSAPAPAGTLTGLGQRLANRSGYQWQLNSTNIPAATFTNLSADQPRVRRQRPLYIGRLQRRPVFRPVRWRRSPSPKARPFSNAFDQSGRRYRKHRHPFGYIGRKPFARHLICGSSMVQR